MAEREQMTITLACHSTAAPTISRSGRPVRRSISAPPRERLPSSRISCAEACSACRICSRLGKGGCGGRNKRSRCRSISSCGPVSVTYRTPIVLVSAHSSVETALLTCSTLVPSIQHRTRIPFLLQQQEPDRHCSRHQHQWCHDHTHLEVVQA